MIAAIYARKSTEQSGVADALQRALPPRPSRRTQVERELEDAHRKLDRLVDALADGSLPADEIKGRLGAEKARKTALQAELTKLSGSARSRLRERVSDVTTLLGRHTAQARQMLRKLVTGKIELEPVGRGRERGYRFRGALCIERLIGLRSKKKFGMTKTRREACSLLRAKVTQEERSGTTQSSRSTSGSTEGPVSSLTGASSKRPRFGDLVHG